MDRARLGDLFLEAQRWMMRSGPSIVRAVGEAMVPDEPMSENQVEQLLSFMQSNAVALNTTFERLLEIEEEIAFEK